MKQLGIAASLVLAGVAAWILWKDLNAEVLWQAWMACREFPAPLLLALLGLVCASFFVAAGYEAAALREIGHPLGWARPLLVACIAYPIGHVVSFPALSAGAMRLRLYSGWGIDSRGIGKMVVLTALPYVLGVTLLLSLSVLLASPSAATALRMAEPVVIAGGLLGLLGMGIYALLVTRRSFEALPSPRLTCWQVLCGATEIVLVAAVLYLLLPAAPAIGWAHFLPLYLIGVLAGQLSSVPAGLGVLEASLILMFPEVPKDRLIAAVLAYRVVFELLPLIAGLTLLAVYEIGSRRGLIGRRWRVSLLR